MKPLLQHQLVYDKECPMCCLYTKAFISCGMLEKKGRVPYTNMSDSLKSAIDCCRARNEIALIDNNSGKVLYGVTALLHVVGHSYPLLHLLTAKKPTQRLLKTLYSFVSYNRRVVVCGKDPENRSSCRPDFHMGYRMAYLLFAIFISAGLLNAFTPLLGSYWPIPKGWIPELLLVAGQLIFQSIVCYCFTRKITTAKLVNYLGNLITVSLMGSLLLVPALLLSGLTNDFPFWAYLTWLGLVVIAMFAEHSRRVQLYKLPVILSFSWLIYRLLISGGCFLWSFILAGN